MTFIQNYATPYSFPEKIKLQPYISLNDKPVMESVIEDEASDKIKKDISDIVTNAWSGKFITKESKSNVSIIIIIVLNIC